MTVGELRERLSRNDGERQRLLGKILREARDTDVWHFTTPKEVLLQWDQLSKYLGRRREFWRSLLEFWKREGLIE